MASPRLSMKRTRMFLSSAPFPPPSEWQGRRKGSSWSFPIDGDLVRRMIDLYGGVQLDSHIRDHFQAVKAKQDELAQISSATDWEGGNPRLHWWQKPGVAWLKRARRGIQADDRGLGKTVMALVAAEELEVKRAIVVSSKTVRELTWEEHVEDWTSYHSITPTGDEEERRRDIHQWDEGYLLLNPKQVSLHLEDLTEVDPPDLLIVDEAHLLRNRKTDIFQAIAVLARKVPNLFLLTGTPAVNLGADVWTLLNLVDPARFTSYWSFVFRFCDVKDNGFGLKVGEVRADEFDTFSRLLSAYSIRRSKSIRDDLPEKDMLTEWVKLQGKQAELYYDMEEKMLATFREHTIEADVRISHITRLRQLVLDPQVLFPDYSEENAKQDRLVEVLKDHEGKALVFTMFAEVAEGIARRLEREGISVVTLTGGTNPKKLRAVRDAIQEGDTQVLVLTIKSGGEGLTLTAADLVVLYDTAWNPTGNEQAEDRIMRDGQFSERVTTMVIRVQDSVEDFMWRTVEGKEQVSADEIIQSIKERHE